MATLFQSFRSSTMPKRLLRYALARLELLDAEALDMDNLDLEIGKNTVFQFRDVGIKLKKLEKLLQLPPALRLQKAKVVVLRVTIPVDFYSSPISVEIDGVQVRLQILSPDRHAARTPGDHTPENPDVVPNTVDLAQSFLQAQPASECKELEEALAAETQDLGASVTISDDGSEDEPIGTGQPLSLPSFLADFLQGIVDRTQIRIRDIKFQLDLDVAVDPASTNPEPVSFQITLDDIDVEGVTSQGQEQDGSPSFIHQEGKRHVSLNQVRAYLISEANVFSALGQSPSTVSPSLASSPAMTRNPPTRESTEIIQDSVAESTNLPVRESTILEPPAADTNDVDESSEPDDPLGDSEEALEIPYDLSDPEEMPEAEDDGPATPRASVYHGYDSSPEQSMFHSTVYNRHRPSESTVLERDAPQWASAYFDEEVAVRPDQVSLPDSVPSVSSFVTPPDVEASSEHGGSFHSSESAGDDLAQSHCFTNEQARSLYMSAYSNPEEPVSIAPSTPPPQLLVQEDLKTESPNSPQDGSPEFHDANLPEASSPSQSRGEQSTLLQESSDQEDLVLDNATVPPRPETPQNQSPRPSTPLKETTESSTDELKAAEQPSPVMPGGWEDEYNSPEPKPSLQSSVSETATPVIATDSTTDEPSTVTAQLMATEKEQVTSANAVEYPGPDEAATPRGPTRLVKELLRTDMISLYLPSQHHHIQVQPMATESTANLSQSLGRSVYPQAPGAFSVHGAASVSRERQNPEQIKFDARDNTLEVDVSPIQIRFDASLGFLLAMVVRKLLSAVQEHGSPQAKGHKQQPTSTQPVPGAKVKLQKLSIDFLSHLGGVADTLGRHLDPGAFVFDTDVLLNATLQNLVVSTSSSKTSKESLSNTKLELESFRFGYANDDIISFDRERPMSTSVRDTFISAGHDVAINITKSGDQARTDIETLPLVVQVDLQRLDETFGWFGGLSGFLNMSSSMASVHSPVIKQGPLIPAKPRGVRFEAPLDPSNKAAVAESKVNLRIGGAYLELRGKECSLSAESTAIKAVSRDEGLGIGMSFLRLSGPHLHNSLADPAINIEAGGIRLDFLSTPKNPDLERLLELITPSKANFDAENDGIMVDTLLRQRRKGSVLRLGVDSLTSRIKNTNQLSVLPDLGDEIAKLSTVAKYLPEDDRPGLMTLVKIHKINASVDCGGQIGVFDGSVDNLELGHITLPSLIAVSALGLSITRNGSEELVRTALVETQRGPDSTPVVMARMIGDEIEPITKLKLHNLLVEYRVPFIMDMLGLADDATPQDFEAGLAASVANLGDQAQTALGPQAESDRSTSKPAKPMTLDIGFKDCLIGLNPLNLASKMIVVLTDAHLEVVLPKEIETKATVDFNKASIFLIDDVKQGELTAGTTKSHHRSSSITSPQIQELSSQGFVDICYISSAKITVDIVPSADGDKQVLVNVRDDLLVLETCADSTQTLITLANALKPPTPPSKEIKYRTNVMPVQDLLASISAEAFGKPEGEYDFDQDFAGAQEMAGSDSDADLTSQDSLGIHSKYYGNQEIGEGEELFDALNTSDASLGTTAQDTEEGVLLSNTLNPASSAISEGSSGDLVIHDNFFAPNSSMDHPPAKIWNANRNTFDRAPEPIVKQSPLKISLRDTHVIWNLFDGYDWVHTRDVISQAVHEVENKAFERQARNEETHIYEEELEDEETIGDFLFNSIYVGIPANRDPGEITRAINAELHDNATETESIATTARTGATNRTARPSQHRSKRLRLNRSRQHKITFELQGVNADVISYPYGSSGTDSSIDVRVKNLDIFDHVPTSTWKKFATYDRDHGEREMGAPMIHLELLNVRPLTDLPASEIVLRATVLPMRLHVDQDALDFITRFFEFKDDNVPVHASPSDVPFIQRAEVNNIPVKLDFKPKRVDYAGLRSGHTSEFMNFIVLEESRLILRHAIIYGVPGFDRLGKTLNDLWTPDVTHNQLPGVIGGLAPVRSLVNIGSGFRDLVEIPIKEYKKDGRVVRSISKGAAAFARTTGTEIVKLGAKLAIGTQYALQGVEDMVSEQRQPVEGTWEGDDSAPEEKRQISLYADPPPNVLQGLRGGARSLARDVNLARDALIAVSGEVMQSQSPSGAAMAVLKRAPTIVFRPAVGVTKVVGQTLLGATNSLDPQHRRRVDDKYKKH